MGKWYTYHARLGAILLIENLKNLKANLGAVLIQFCVQGAWGAVPAYVAELSPNSVRGTPPRLGNQLGVVVAGALPYLEASFARGRSYAGTIAAMGPE